MFYGIRWLIFLLRHKHKLPCEEGIYITWPVRWEITLFADVTIVKAH